MIPAAAIASETAPTEHNENHAFARERVKKLRRPCAEGRRACGRKDRNMTPYGYKIVNNRPVKSAEDAGRVYAFFKSYSEGRSVSEAMEAASLPVGTTTAKLMLRRALYKGEGGYPPIIPADLFAEVQSELARRTHAPTRKREPVLTVKSAFRLDPVPSSPVWTEDACSLQLNGSTPVLSRMKREVR